jgi:hypothetical protein
MSAEGWAWLWLGGVYLLWTAIFVGVVIFALRNDTNVELDGSDGGGSDRVPDHRRPRPPRGRRPGLGAETPSWRRRGGERPRRNRRQRERAGPQP